MRVDALNPSNLSKTASNCVIPQEDSPVCYWSMNGKMV